MKGSYKTLSKNDYFRWESAVRLSYQKRKNTIIEYEAWAGKLILDMFVDCSGYNTIIYELNCRGYKTREGKSFGKNSLQGILCNERHRDLRI